VTSDNLRIVELDDSDTRIDTMRKISGPQLDQMIQANGSVDRILQTLQDADQENTFASVGHEDCAPTNNAREQNAKEAKKEADAITLMKVREEVKKGRKPI
jgi:hypothetical protein